MFRIQQAAGATEIAVTVEGQLVGEYVSAAESCCNAALSSGKPVIVLLKDVSPIDAEGRALLRRLLARGVGIQAVGVYTQYLVEEAKRALQPATEGGERPH